MDTADILSGSTPPSRATSLPIARYAVYASIAAASASSSDAKTGDALGDGTDGSGAGAAHPLSIATATHATTMRAKFAMGSTLGHGA